MEWGVKTRDEMIKIIRDYATRQRDQANAILNASDVEFEVHVVDGSVVQRFVREAD